MSSIFSRAGLVICATVVLASAAVSHASLPVTTSPAWTYSTRGSAAQFGSVYDGDLYVASYDGWVRQLNLHTGSLIREWNVDTSAGCYSAPVKANNGSLYVFSKGKRLYRLDTSPTPTAVKVADYSSDPGITRVESLAYDSATDLFFLGTAPYLRAVNSSGAHQFTLNHGNYNWGQPMSADGYLYTFDVFNDREKVHKYDLTGGTPTSVWNCDFPARSVYLSKGVDGDGDTLLWALDWEHDNPSLGGKVVGIYDDGPNAGTKKWEQSFSHTIKHVSLWEGHNTLVLPAMNGTVEYRSASTGAYLGATAISTPDGVSQSPWSQVTICGDLAIVSTMDKTPGDPNNLHVINLNTREVIWKSPALTGGYASCMIPIVSEGMAVVGTYQSGAAWSAFDLGAGNSYEFTHFANKRNNGQATGGLLTLEVVPGDATGEGYVTGADYTIWAANYDPAGSGATWPEGDWTGDGKVTGADYTLWAGGYNPPPPSAVPELATIGILAAGAMALVRRRRCRS